MIDILLLRRVYLYVVRTFGRSNEALFPQNEHEISLTNFKLIAERFLQSVGKRGFYP